jgi:hypothetical protein
LKNFYTGNNRKEGREGEKEGGMKREVGKKKIRDQINYS